MTAKRCETNDDGATYRTADTGYSETVKRRILAVTVSGIRYPEWVEAADFVVLFAGKDCLLV